MPKVAGGRATRGRAAARRVGVLAALVAACTVPGLVSPARAADPMVPLTDLAAGTYQGRQGGLYPGGSNVVPDDHAAAGLQWSKMVQPLDGAGNPSPAGKMVLLSIGYSNASDQWCHRDRTYACDPGSFMSRAEADPALDRERLVIVNGATGGQDAVRWADPGSPNYGIVAGRLSDAGVTPQQVQAVWFKTTIIAGTSPETPRVLLPDPNATAYQLVGATARAVRTLKATYPNLRQVFLSSRTYGGWSDDLRVNEPVSYETGFGVKWLVEAQIAQMRNGGVPVDARAGDLDYRKGVAPWIGWGPYVWAAGATPRSDGLTWPREDFIADAIHPSPSGVAKAGGLLMEFFKTSPLARSWFLPGSTTAPPPSPDPGTPVTPPPPAPVAPAPAPAPAAADGYRMVAADGGVFTFGERSFAGSLGGVRLNRPIVGGATNPATRAGYWMVAGDGGVFNFGDAAFHGSLGDRPLDSPVVEIEPTPSGRGYFLVDARGRVFPFGDARTGIPDARSLALNQPIVGMTVTPSGGGFWLVAADGGIFAFGDAGFFGSTGDLRLNAPVIDLAATPDGQGYHLLGADGGVFSFGRAVFAGSTGDIRLNRPAVAMLMSPNGAGYWIVASDGGVFAFGGARFLGSMGDVPLNSPVLDAVD